MMDKRSHFVKSKSSAPANRNNGKIIQNKMLFAAKNPFEQQFDNSHLGSDSKTIGNYLKVCTNSISVVNDCPRNKRFNSIQKTKSRVVVILENEGNNKDEEDKLEVIVKHRGQKYTPSDPAMFGQPQLNCPQYSPHYECDNKYDGKNQFSASRGNDQGNSLLPPIPPVGEARNNSGSRGGDSSPHKRSQSQMAMKELYYEATDENEPVNQEPRFKHMIRVNKFHDMDLKKV